MMLYWLNPESDLHPNQDDKELFLTTSAIMGDSITTLIFKQNGRVNLKAMSIKHHSYLILSIIIVRQCLIYFLYKIKILLFRILPSVWGFSFNRPKRVMFIDEISNSHVSDRFSSRKWRTSKSNRFNCWSVLTNLLINFDLTYFLPFFMKFKFILFELIIF